MRGQRNYPVVGGLVPELLAKGLIKLFDIFGWPKGSRSSSSFAGQVLSDMRTFDEGATLESLAVLGEEEDYMTRRAMDDE